MSAKVFIILLNYESADDTLEAINSLEEIDYDNYEIIIVDNASRDNSLEVIKKAVGNKHIVINSGANKGFAYGNNKGIDYAKAHGGNYVLLLNNDTTVERGFLRILVNTMEEEENGGIVTGKILNYYNKELVWYGGGEIKWNRFYGMHYEDNRIKEKKEVTFATGCLMLLSMDLINKIGGLPEEYFMYYEDVDYCVKTMRAGYKIIYNPESIIYHKISAASGGEESAFSVEWNTRNRLRFMKNFKVEVSNVKYYKSLSFFYVTRILKGMNYLRQGKINLIKALLRGIKKNNKNTKAI